MGRGRRWDTFARSTIRIPPHLATAFDEDDYPARLEWLAALPELVREIASAWELELGNPYLPGGQCAWVAPARNQAGDELVLKLAWRHREAENEADGLQHWNGDGAVRCFATRQRDNTTALLLERCTPGPPSRSGWQGCSTSTQSGSACGYSLVAHKNRCKA